MEADHEFRSRACLFRRDDRDQLTNLVNAHLSAVIPEARVSVNAVLSSLERQPDEYIVDPWVVERAAIIVEQDDWLVAAAHLQRFADDSRVGDDYRGVGLIQWFLSVREEDPAQPAAATLMRACEAQLRVWAVTMAYADGQLPFPGVYGIPAWWPHVRRALEQAGFVHDGATESVLMAPVSGLAGREGAEASNDLVVHRELGASGIRFLATRDAKTRRTRRSRSERPSCRAPADRQQDGGVHGLGRGPERARTTRGGAAGTARPGVGRLLAVIEVEDAEERALLSCFGFREVTSNARSWRRRLI